jgi:hypothetical protein
MGAFHGDNGLLASPDELSLQAGNLTLELQDSLDPGQIETFCRELLDATQSVEVVLAIATAVADRAGRVEQAPALVDPQCLGMDARQFGGDGDHKDRSVTVGRGHD